MKKLLPLLLSFILLLGFTPAQLGCLRPAMSQGIASRVYNAPRNPRRLLTKQFSAGANVFTTVDPSPSGTPLTITSATGDANADGSASIAFQAGFTPPLAVTVYYWQADAVTPANSCWTRLGSAAAQYTTSVDHTYTICTFQIGEFVPFIVQTGAAVTGNVYTDSKADPNNNNTVAGY